LTSAGIPQDQAVAAVFVRTAVHRLPAPDLGLGNPQLDAPPRIPVTCSDVRRTPDSRRRASRARP
jgi:hypothetical protein